MHKADEARIATDGKLNEALETIQQIQVQMNAQMAEIDQLKVKFAASQQTMQESENAIIETVKMSESQVSKIVESQKCMEDQSQKVQEFFQSVEAKSHHISMLGNMLEQLNSTFPNQMAASINNVGADFEQKINDFKAQMQIAPAETTE